MQFFTGELAMLCCSTLRCKLRQESTCFELEPIDGKKDRARVFVDCVDNASSH